MSLTLSQLRQLLPKNKYVEHWHTALAMPQTELGGSTLLDDYDINTPKRIAAFIAQCAHESGGFSVLQENLNYKPQALRRLFSKYFTDDVIAGQYCAMGNGDESSGDGYRFRGRGLIQLTGRDNYQAFADSLEMAVNDVPEYLATFEGAAQSACWFWEKNGLNKWADAGDIKELTRRINGGFIGLEDRIKHYEHALHILAG